MSVNEKESSVAIQMDTRRISMLKGVKGGAAEGDEEHVNLYDSIVSSEIVADLLETVDQFHWPVFDFCQGTNSRGLSTLSYFLFQREGLFNNFQLPTLKFWKFINAIEKGYHPDLPCMTIQLIFFN
jgi:hypothetical protein